MGYYTHVHHLLNYRISFLYYKNILYRSKLLFLYQLTVFFSFCLGFACQFVNSFLFMFSFFSLEPQCRYNFSNEWLDSTKNGMKKVRCFQNRSSPFLTYVKHLRRFYYHNIPVEQYFFQQSICLMKCCFDFVVNILDLTSLLYIRYMPFSRSHLNQYQLNTSHFFVINYDYFSKFTTENKLKIISLCPLLFQQLFKWVQNDQG